MGGSVFYAPKCNKISTNIKSYLPHLHPYILYLAFKTKTSHSQETPKGGMLLKNKSKIIETVLKAVSTLITAVLAVIKAIGLFGSLADAKS